MPEKWTKKKIVTLILDLVVGLCSFGIFSTGVVFIHVIGYNQVDPIFFFVKVDRYFVFDLGLVLVGILVGILITCYFIAKNLENFS